MVQAENIDSRCSSFQLDDRSRCDHHSLAHLSKFPLNGAGMHPPRFISREISPSGHRLGLASLMDGTVPPLPFQLTPLSSSRAKQPG
jgi:hypothetical protein